MNKRCMLIILLLCVLKTSGQSDELTDADYNNSNYEDYDVSKENSAATDSMDATTPIYTISDLSSSGVPSTNQATDITTQPTITVPITLPASITQDSKEPKCPQNCKCTDGLDFVDCSHQHLVQIPKNLPHQTVQLNLSHNQLKTLNVSDLIDCKELRQLFLNDNQIETIVNTDEFSKLPGLHHIDFTSNTLQPLQGHEFTKARGLATLLLTANKNVAQSNVPIVQTHKLKTLNLANCSIAQLSENIFQNLSSLVALDLDNNPLDLAQSVKAFKYLVNLRTLNIPTVSRDVIIDLCQSLESIDIVHLTQENYDISCFLLTSGSSYDESTIKIGQTTLSTADIENNGLYRIATNPPSIKKKSTTQKPTTSTERKDLVDEPNMQTSEQKISPISQNESKNEKTLNGTDSIGSTPDDDTTQAKVDVPQHIIYMLLIGLIAITLIALLIGVLCRLDCCGIKTKCCRRRQNRAETGDRVQPHEEIPLNKV